MIDVIRKAMLAGVGAAAISADRAEKALGDLVQKGKLSAGEARDAARRLAEDGKHEFEEAASALESRFDDMLKKLGKGHLERIAALEARVEALEAESAKKEAPAEAQEGKLS